MNSSEITPILLTTLGIILGSGSIYAAIVASRVRGRYEALESSLNLMSVSNGELRAENDRLRADVQELRTRIDVLQSDVVRTLVDEIAAAAAVAVAGVITDIRPHLA